jgi:sugar phosphate isomerase/epimerase
MRTSPVDEHLVELCEAAGTKLCLGVASFSTELRSHRMTLEDMLDTAIHLGFRRVELCDRTIPEEAFERASVMESVGKRGLEISAIDVRNDFTDPDLAALDANVAHVTKWIEICARLSVRIARVWVGTRSNDDGAFSRAVACLRKVVEVAERNGVFLALENHGGLSENPDALIRLVNWVGSPWLGICADFGWLAPADRLSGLSKLIPAAIHLHAKAHLFSADGREVQIDYEAIGAVAKKSQYAGLFTIEYEGDESGTARTGGILKTARLIHRHFLSSSSSSVGLRAGHLESYEIARPGREGLMPHASYISRIQTTSLWEEARKPILEICSVFAAKSETCGVAIIGGLADLPYRRFVDRHSDLDIAIFLSIPQAGAHDCPKRFAREHPELIPGWLPDFQFYIDVGRERMEVNCHQLIIEIEERRGREWPVSKQEAYLYSGEVVYDPLGRLARLISARCGEETFRGEVTTLISQLPWYGWINPARQIERGFLVNARMLMNDACAILVKLVFAANCRRWPHPKWMFEMARDLAWTPSGFETQLSNVLGGGVDRGEIETSIAVMKQLGVEVIARLDAVGIAPGEPFRYASIYLDIDRQLTTKPLAHNHFFRSVDPLLVESAGGYRD